GIKEINRCRGYLLLPVLCYRIHHQRSLRSAGFHSLEKRSECRRQIDDPARIIVQGSIAVAYLVYLVAIKAEDRVHVVGFAGDVLLPSGVGRVGKINIAFKSWHRKRENLFGSMIGIIIHIPLILYA